MDVGLYIGRREQYSAAVSKANWFSRLFYTELLNNLRPVSPKPGHLERVKTPLGSANAMDEDVQPYKERFLKITVRHITDGQVRLYYADMMRARIYVGSLMYVSGVSMVYVGAGKL